HSLISCASMLRQLTPSLFPYTTLFRSREQRVEARVRALQVEDDRIRVRRLDTLDVDLEGGAADEPVGLHVRLSREDNVVGGEFRSEEHTSELQSRENLVCRLLLEKKKQ